jgi:general secretion pathway protein I
MAYCKPQKGFTLVEILIALAVLAIVMSALLVSSSNYVSNAAYLKQATLSQWVAENVATEYQIKKDFPRVGSKQDGETEMAGVKWRWRVQVKKLNLPVPVPTVRQLEIRVILDEGNFDSPLALLTSTVQQQ